MTNATITISFANNAITASLTTIDGQEHTDVNVTWAIGTGVAVINNITMPTALDDQSTLNTPTQSGTVWSISDRLGDTPKTYGYTITVFTTEGTTVTQDPQIINNPSTM